MRIVIGALFLSAVLVASAQEQRPLRIQLQQISPSLRLSVSVTYTKNRPGICCSTLARVQLVDLRDLGHAVEIATIRDDYEIAFAIERADDRSVVLSRSDPDYGKAYGSVKLFFDSDSKRLLKRIDIEAAHAIEFADDAEAARALGVTPAAIQELRRRGVFATHANEPSLPATFRGHPLPQSTYQEFARVRPSRVKDGYSAGSTQIEEAIGAFQRDGDRLWIAKTFYDGEGTTGVGATGSLDASGKYTFLEIPELFDWSVQAVLVEPEAIWAGRVSHPEGADRSGGLLRYDRKTRQIRLYDVPDVIHAIARVGGAIFLGTNHGLYVINGNTRTRFRAEPDIDGRFGVVIENLSPVQTR
jgi:hypothetical protein